MRYAAWRIITIALAVPLLQACSFFDKSGDAPMAIVGGSLGSLEAFKETVYPVAREGCASCHGNNVHPLFAVDNEDRAHSRTLPYVDFENVPLSTLLERSGNGHCAGCNSQMENDFEDAINEWDELRKASEGNEGGNEIGPRIMFSSKSLVNAIGQPDTLEWRFADEGHPSLQNFAIELTAEDFSGTAWQFDDPTLVRLNPSAESVYVEDLWIHLNEVVDPSVGTTFRGILNVFSVENSTLLSGGASIVLQQNGPQDKVSISFKDIRVVP